MSVNSKLKKLLLEGPSRGILLESEKKLLQFYREAYLDIEAKLSKVYNKYGADVSKEMSRFKRLKRLELSISKEIGQALRLSDDEIHSALIETADLSYRNVGTSINEALRTEIGFPDPTKQMITKAIDNELLKVKWKGRLAKHSKRAVKTISKEIAKGIQSGKPFIETAKQIEKKVVGLKNNALRIVRTETHRTNTEAKLEAFKDSEKYFAEAGIKTDRVIVSIFDDKTRKQSELVAGRKADKNGLFAYPNGRKYRGPGLTGVARYDINDREEVILQVQGDDDVQVMEKVKKAKPKPVKKTVKKTTPKAKPKATAKPETFTPAKTMAEFESRVLDSGFNGVQVTAKRFNLNQANGILDSIERESRIAKLKMNKLIVLEDKRKKWAGVYSPSQVNIGINLAHNKERALTILKPFKDTIKSLEDIIVQYDKRIEQYKAFIEKGQSRDFYKRRIALYKKEVRKIDKLIDGYNVKIKNGEKPKFYVTSEYFEKEFDKIKSTMTHELGHYYDYEKKITIGKPWEFRGIESITDYGLKNERELLAEWFAYYRDVSSEGIPEKILKVFKELDNGKP